MSSRHRWYALSLVLLVLGAVVLSFAFRPDRNVAGTPAAGEAATTISTTTPDPAPGGPTITVPSTTSPSFSFPDPGTTPGPPPEVEPDGTVGAETGDDPYYPDAGNGGYDVTAYAVSLIYDPDSGRLQATTVIDATVTEATRLGRFSFDLQPTMTVSEVLVGDTPAGFDQHDAKLTVTPIRGLDPGTAARVTVTYRGTPAPIIGGTSGLADGGWFNLDSGGAVAIGEPFSASAWYPVNEIPTDRATFRIDAQVPTGWKVISNGLPDPADVPASEPGLDRFRWVETSEMASYLSTVYIDTFTQTQENTPSGLPVINAYAKGQEGDRTVADRTGEFVDFLASRFGPYPFASTGGIYLADSFGYALETQTRPVYSSGTGNESTVVHELAHQWFGDAVTVERWADICLNECFASYAEWLWAEDNGADLDDKYRQTVATSRDVPSFWQSPLYDMGAGNEFGAVYSRGPLALHALRAELGDEKFDELLLSWIEEHSGQSASWADFESLVTTIAGRDETAFLQAWFHSTTVPADEFLYPGDLTP